MPLRTGPVRPVRSRFTMALSRPSRQRSVMLLALDKLAPVLEKHGIVVCEIPAADDRLRLLDGHHDLLRLRQGAVFAGVDVEIPDTATSSANVSRSAALNW